MSPSSRPARPARRGGTVPLAVRLLGLLVLGLLASAPAAPASAVRPFGAPGSAAPTSADSVLSVHAADGHWVPPSGGAVLRYFDPPAEPWGAGHRGADWAVPEGRVVAPGTGTVRFVGTVAGRPVITLAHDSGMLSSLEPVAAPEGLSVGDRVEAGELLGAVGSTADRTVTDGTTHCPQRCVHWGVRIPDAWIVDGSAWDRYVDPLVLLGWSGPSVLWPLEGGPPGGSQRRQSAPGAGPS